MRPATLPSRASFADRPHGTRLRYIAGCKCVPCRAANSRYECERLAARKRGEWNGIVSADAARDHIHTLARRGIGYRAVAAAADVARTVVADVKSGEKKRIRAATARRILGVTRDAVSDAALVPAGPTWKRIRELMEEGFTKTRLARELGSRAKVPALQLQPGWVLARTALKVEILHRRYLEAA